MQIIAELAKKFKLIAKNAMNKENAFYVRKDSILIQFNNALIIAKQFN